MTYREKLTKVLTELKAIVKANWDIKQLRIALLGYAMNNLKVTPKHFRENYIQYLLLDSELTKKEKRNIVKALRMRGVKI